MIVLADRRRLMQFVIVCVANKNISVTESDVGTTER